MILYDKTGNVKGLFLKWKSLSEIHYGIYRDLDLKAHQNITYIERNKNYEKNPFFIIKLFDKTKFDFEQTIFSNPDVCDVNEREVDEFDMKSNLRKRKFKKDNRM